MFVCLQSTCVLFHWLWGLPQPPTYTACPVFSVCLSAHQFVCLLPECRWTYHSGMIQRKSWRMAGERSSCSVEGQARLMVRPFCRLIRSSCLDRWGSGLGFPWGPLPPLSAWEAPGVLASRMRVGAGRALVGYHRGSWGVSPPHSAWHPLSVYL